MSLIGCDCRNSSKQERAAARLNSASGLPPGEFLFDHQAGKLIGRHARGARLNGSA
jgi:hypothetical protein